jgi:hypothetical protein
MEDISDAAIDSGILFGPGNPNNWKRNLPGMLKAAFSNKPPPTATTVAATTFRAFTAVHATFLAAL